MFPVAIVTLNRAALLLETISSLRRTAPGAPLVVVDNGSNEAATHHCLAMMERVGVRTVRNGRNLGTGRAKNQAVALLPPAELMCVADNDVRFRPGWVQTAEAAFDAWDRLGVLGLWKHPFHHTLSAERRGGLVLLVRDLMPGVAWVLRRRLWGELGGMVDSPPHTYGIEDTDFARRVQARGLWVAGLEVDQVEHLGHLRTDGQVACGSTGTGWLPA